MPPETKTTKDAPAVTAATAPTAPAKDEKDMTPQELSAKGAAAPPKGPKTLVVTHGSYTGPGCPDVSKRKRPEDVGFRYDHDHPAVIGEHVGGLSDPEVKRMLASKCFKHPEQVQVETDEA